MERQQHQHGSKQPRPPLTARSSQQRRKLKASFSLGKLRWNRSLALLGSAWVVVVVVALTAVSGLLSPNMSSNQPPEVASVRETAPAARANNQNRIPLWLFGAIALSCAAGSILVSKQVNRPQRPHKSIKPKRLALYTAPEAIEPAPPTLPPQPQVATVPSFALVHPPLRPTPTAAPFMAPTTLMQLAHQVSQPTGQVADASAPIALEDKKPLDWGEASLADKLDIRKQRSISSLL